MDDARDREAVPGVLGIHAGKTTYCMLVGVLEQASECPMMRTEYRIGSLTLPFFLLSLACTANQAVVKL